MESGAGFEVYIGESLTGFGDFDNKVDEGFGDAMEIFRGI